MQGVDKSRADVFFKKCNRHTTSACLPLLHKKNIAQCSAAPHTYPMDYISVHELKQKLESGETFTLVDVREPWEHEEFNIGGRLIPVGEVMNRAWELENHKNDEVVVYCRSGARSGMAQALLQAQGFSKVRNLVGGMLAWKEAFGG